MTRYHPRTGQLQLAATLRVDTQDWAVPGRIIRGNDSLAETFKHNVSSKFLDEDEENEQVRGARLELATRVRLLPTP